MKAVIMAGGYATRLWPITKSRAKPLLPLGSKKIIDVVYEKLIDFDIPIILSTNKRFEEDFREWSKGKKVEIIAENTRNEEEKLGAVRALAEIAKDVKEDMLVVAGDNVFSFSIKEFYRKFETIKKPLIALYDVGDLELAKRYGVAELEGERIVKFHEKPEKPPSTLIGIGLYLFPKKTVEILLEYVENTRKSDNLGDFISYLCQKEEVYGYPFNGSWYDVGNPDSYIEAFKSYTDHYVDRSAQIEKSVKIIEPVVIGKGAKIGGRSIIGPYTFIGENCVIDSSDVSETIVFENTMLSKVKLWRSIVDDKCEIRNIQLVGSIIGRNAKIQGG
ncbi:MAG: glucose-phosphate thymidylyltransferase [Archaeoglobaceae archaeon]|nr:glucose-phosphate thymidylyltransferase [Archaeoglobaceae archaeon]